MQPTKPAFFAFGPRNFRLMWLGLGLLAAGFITMMFGDKANYGEDFVGITLGPLLLIVGFVVEFFAIMVRDPSQVLTPPAATAAAPGFVPPATATPGVPPTVPPAGPSYKRF